MRITFFPGTKTLSLSHQLMARPDTNMVDADFGILNRSINLQLLIADPEKDSVTINLLVSCDNGMNYESFDSYKIPQKQF